MFMFIGQNSGIKTGRIVFKLKTSSSSVVPLGHVRWTAQSWCEKNSLAYCMNVGGPRSTCRTLQGVTNLGLSENSVPLNPMVNDHYSY